MIYMRKLGEAFTFLLLMSAAGSAGIAQADTAFEYQPVQIVYVEQESFVQKYGNQGPLAEMALRYEAELELEALRAETIEAKADLVRAAEEAEADLYFEQQLSVDAAIAALWPHVGVTPYGFGTTPEIWDCSGLTQWYLAQRGITDVVHSATAQVRDIRSTIVDAPIAGDLVAFQKKGASATYFHIGVYIGGGMMIHASNPEKDTNLQLVQEFADSENSRVVYIRY